MAPLTTTTKKRSSTPSAAALTAIRLASLKVDPSKGRRRAQVRRKDFILWASLVSSTTGQLLAAAIMSPLTFLSDPISTTYTVLVFPALFAFLFVVQFVLLFLKVVGFGKLAAGYNEGYGPANWGNAPYLNSQVSVPVMNRMRPVLGKALPPPFDNNDTTRVYRYFDLDVAQGLLLMSSLVYERDANPVQKAAATVQEAATGQEAATVQEAAIGQEAAKVQQVTKVQEAANGTKSDPRTMLEESELKINKVAAEWNMKFKCVTEIKSFGGPYAGLFYPTNNEPWMVLAFKGTTPNNFSEWLVDSTFTKTNANVYLDGNVHEGFYSSIFPDHGDPESPYSRMIEYIQIKAAEMRGGRGGPGQKINLWITGHSLGSALAALMYARLLKSPADLGDDVCLRYSYLYGTPRLGDINFCSKVASDTITPITKDQIMWRIANNSDIVTCVPPGLGDDPRMQTSLPSNSLLNYGHVGAGMHLLPKTAPSQTPYQIDTRFFIGADVKIVAVPRDYSIICKPARNTISMLLRLMPGFLRDHLPYKYFESLERLQPSAEQYDGVHSTYT